jgi:asparagine synthase (glutamine-hydrolysing)
MCGIAGILTADRRAEPDRGVLQAMTDALAHRGPDGEGFHIEPGIALGHRRLAVIDPEGGEQPMFNEDGTVAIVFNGEIYNFEALRRELAALGHVFHNRCDTEAIVHAWESWGPDCVSRFTGMFAFALWDRVRGQLFCARDRLGKKPFHFAWANGDFVFASELGAFAAHPGIARRLRPDAIEDFFTFGYVPEPATIFDGIAKLPAAHWLLVERGRAVIQHRYWSPPETIAPIEEGDAVQALRHRLAQAVSARLVSDVPLGAFLSGGVDSSAVVAMAAGEAGGARAEPLNTFTIGFDGAEDETPYAHRVAQCYATRQHDERAGPIDMIEGARAQAAVFGEPFGDSSSVPTLAVCRLARKHATVALSGDGGDEVFAGYRRTRWHHMVSAARRYLPPRMRREAIGRLAAWYPKLDRAPRFLRARHTLTELSLDDAEGFCRIATKVHTDARRALFSPSLRAALDGHDPHEALRRLMTEAEDWDPLLAAQRADLLTWLPGDILVKADRASMAASLEMRAPFLDYSLVEWGMALPASLKIRGGQGKYVLKKMLEPLLPHDILYRPKRGFTTDLAPLFRRKSARLRARLLEGPLPASGFFDTAEIEAMIARHASGQFDHAQPLWLLLAFEGFLAAMQGVAPQPAHSVA